MATKPTKTGSKKAPPFVAMKKGGKVPPFVAMKKGSKAPTVCKECGKSAKNCKC